MQFWQKDLRQKTKHQRSNNPNARFALLGVGNELNADDAAGVLIARRLQDLLHEVHDVEVYDCGTVPENFSGLLRRNVPDFVLIIDAGNFGEPSGTIALFEWDDTDGMSSSTHSLPPSVYAAYLMREFDCEVGLLLIQAQSVAFLEPICAEVETAITQVVQGISDIFT